MFVTDIELWEECGRANSEFFGAERPTTTMVEVNRLIDLDMPIERPGPDLSATCSSA